MAEEEEGSHRALLAHPAEDELWDRVEAAQPDSTAITVAELLKNQPNHVIAHLERAGVQKLGSFTVRDSLILGRLGDDSILTMGSDQAGDLDWRSAWMEELRRPVAVMGGRDGPGWSTDIPVEAYVVPIHGAAFPDKDGLVQPLLRRWQAGGCGYSVFALPAVQAVIDWKWTKFARKLILWELAFFSLWMASFFAFTAAFQDEDASLSLRELLETRRGRFAAACDCLALVGMAPFVAIEFATVGAYGIKGWATMWNLLDTATYALQIFIVAMHVGRINALVSGWTSIAIATQCLLLLFRLQYFSRVFTPTRFAFLDDLRAVIMDVRWYLLFILLIVFGYAAAFQILFRQDQKEHNEFSDLGKSFITMVTWSAGNADLGGLYENAHNPVAACIFGSSFVFILGMVLINLLIGLMTASLERVTANEGVRFMLSKAQAIDEIEAVLPAFVERRFPHLFPSYLHVLRVDPEKLDSVQKDGMWAGHSQDARMEALKEEEKGGGEEKGGEDRKERESLQVQMAELLKEVKALRAAVMEMNEFATSPQVATS